MDYTYVGALLIAFLVLLVLLIFAAGIVAIYKVTEEQKRIDREIEELFKQERARKERALLERIKSGKGIE